MRTHALERWPVAASVRKEYQAIKDRIPLQLHHPECYLSPNL
ncbi:hypothetical protein [uncultured Meiothermus sp.]|nr:hypothetical protein [uncultured Meiothermus sp.]